MHLPTLGLNPLLLFFQDLFIDRAVVEGVQELLLLLLKHLKPTRVASRFLLGVLKERPGVLLNSLANRLPLALGQPDTSVVALYRPLNILDLEIATPTVPPPTLMAKTTEVVVEATSPPDAVEDQTPSTEPAEQRAPEVVFVLARAVAAQASRIQDLLHLLKGRHVDEVRMSPVGVL